MCVCVCECRARRVWTSGLAKMIESEEKEKEVEEKTEQADLTLFSP